MTPSMIVDGSASSISSISDDMDQSCVESTITGDPVLSRKRSRSSSPELNNIKVTLKQHRGSELISKKPPVLEDNSPNMNSSSASSRPPKVTIVFSPFHRSNAEPDPKSKSAKKSSSKANGKKVQTKISIKHSEPKMKAKKVRPKSPSIEVVEPPDFIPYITDLDEAELQCRLFIREYVLRFEKHCQLPLKHINIINDVTGNWGDVTFKTLAVSILRIIYSENVPIVPEIFLKNAIKEIEKTASDNDKIWSLVVSILETQVEGSEDGRGSAIQKSENKDEPLFKTANGGFEKLKLIEKLILLSLSGSYIRETLELEHDTMRQKVVDLTERIKSLQESQATEINGIRRQRAYLPAEKREEWAKKYRDVQARHAKELKAAQEDVFRRKRKYALRNLPLGTDVFGNTYWLFSERSKNKIGWGSWIMCSKASHLPSPTGHLIFPKISGDVAMDDTMSVDDDMSTTSSELSTNLLGDNTNWYSIQTHEDAQRLVEWIQYSATVAFKRDERSKIAAEEKPENGSESDDEIYYDDFVQELYRDGPVQLTNSPRKVIPAFIGASKESIGALVKELLYIGDFLPSKSDAAKT